MNPDGTNFAEQYRSALVDFLLGNGGEAALLRAYDWGREALASGMTILEANAIHHEAMHSSVLGPLLKEPAQDLATRGQEFLWQSLAPFEMARRGFIEANATLRELNETLNQRVAERTESLRASEERYRELFENANDIIYTLDLGGELHLSQQGRRNGQRVPSRGSFADEHRANVGPGVRYAGASGAGTPYRGWVA